MMKNEGDTMKIRKRLSFFMTVVMLLSSGSAMPVRAEEQISQTAGGSGGSVKAEDLQIGDYVQMGSYYDEPILWRCVDIDEKGMLMLSDRILCLKTYDAPGENESGSHSRYAGRKTHGSNYWKDSNIRQWLNSDAAAGEIAWTCGNPPSEENTEHNAYADEAGFLNAFTSLEKEVIKPVTQKSLLAAADKEIAGAKGSELHTYNKIIYSVSDGRLVYESILENYDDAYFEEVEDRVFLLDVKQIQNVFNNTPKLGLWYHIGKLTDKAVENSDYKSSLIKADEDWYNWLRSPYVHDEGNQCSVRHVNRDGQIGNSVTKADDIGVRPAFYIKEDTVFPTGDGKADTPYLLTGEDSHTHTLTHYDEAAATCTEPGTGEYWKCEGEDGCGKMFRDEDGTVETEDIPEGEEAKGHSYGNWEITAAPTLEAKGEARRVCQADETHKEIKELPVLTDTEVWTEGEQKQPTEKESGSQQYISEFGTVTVTIPATGGTPPLPAEEEEKKPDKEDDKPDIKEEEKKPDKEDNKPDKEWQEQQEQRDMTLNAGLKVSQEGKKINISWGRLSDADGYNVYVQYCGRKFNNKSLNQVVGAKNTSIKIEKVNGKKLNLKKNYKVYVEAYKLSDGQKKILGKTITAHIVGKNNSKYTNVKAVKVKKNSYTLNQGGTVTIKAKAVLVSKGKKQLSNAHAREFRYASSDKQIATVSKNGKVKAVGTGTCIAYVYARNGYAEKIKITVK
ncbi:MAG: Ig-like domain-containing protein [Clostridium sp.]|nr:Ig-like domain-containing protein [Clostridium sp.]